MKLNKFTDNVYKIIHIATKLYVINVIDIFSPIILLLLILCGNITLY